MLLKTQKHYFDFETKPFSKIFDAVKAIVDFRHIAVFYLEGSETTLIAYRGPMSHDQLLVINFDISSSMPLSTMFSTGTPLLINDMESDHPVAIDTRQRLERFPDHPFSYLKSYLGFPLYSEGRIYAFLDVAHDQRGAFDQESLELLRGFIEKESNEILIATLLSVNERIAYESNTLSEIDQTILTNLDLSESLKLVITKIYQHIPAQLVELFLSEDVMSVFVDKKMIPSNVYSLTMPCELNPILENVMSNRETLRIADILNPPTGQEFKFQDMRARSLLFMPIQTCDEIFGVIAARDKDFGAYNPADERILKTIADRTGIVIKNAILYHRERENLHLGEEIALMQEQQRIAQALHDSVAQLLFRLGLEVKALEKNIEPGSNEIERFRTIERLITRSDEELRSAIFALRENDFYNKTGQIEALNKLISDFQLQTGISTILVIPKEMIIIPYKIMDTIFRVIRESLVNIHKHSGAQSAMVSLNFIGSILALTVQDDGKGLLERSREQETKRIHFGIDMMRRMVTKVGGTFLIDENEECGVIVKVQIPLPTGESS
jgi:signal transduction histidine kinase